jgi:hypothetical protein
MERNWKYRGIIKPRSVQYHFERKSGGDSARNGKTDSEFEEYIAKYPDQWYNFILIGDERGSEGSRVQEVR